MFWGRRRTFLSIVSCGIVLLVVVTMRQGIGNGTRSTAAPQAQASRSRSRGVPTYKRSPFAYVVGHRARRARVRVPVAAANSFKYRILDNYNEADDENITSANQRQSGVVDPLGIRIFSSASDQLLYLYSKLLSDSWTPDFKNLAVFRDVFFRQTNNLTVQDELLLHRQNVKLGDSLPYALTNTMSKDGLKYYYNVTQKILAEIPESSPLSGRHFGQCSVVGNSGILRNSKCGKHIDAADFVFRANVPPLQLYAQDAGLKTNLSTMNPSVISKRYNRLRRAEDHLRFAKAIHEYNNMLWLPCMGSVKMVNTCLLAKHSLDLHSGANPKTVISNPNHYMAVQRFWNARNLTQFLSTGFYLTHLSLAMCHETHLYGFWPFSTRVPDGPAVLVNNTVSVRQMKVRYHYFDNLPGPNIAHSMQDEFSALIQMHKLGMLRMHINRCNV